MSLNVRGFTTTRRLIFAPALYLNTIPDPPNFTLLSSPAVWVIVFDRGKKLTLRGHNTYLILLRSYAAVIGGLVLGGLAALNYLPEGPHTYVANTLFILAIAATVAFIQTGIITGGPRKQQVRIDFSPTGIGFNHTEDAATLTFLEIGDIAELHIQQSGSAYEFRVDNQKAAFTCELVNPQALGGIGFVEAVGEILNLPKRNSFKVGPRTHHGVGPDLVNAKTPSDAATVASASNSRPAPGKEKSGNATRHYKRRKKRGRYVITSGSFTGFGAERLEYFPERRVFKYQPGMLTGKFYGTSDIDKFLHHTEFVIYDGQSSIRWRIWLVSKTGKRLNLLEGAHFTLAGATVADHREVDAEITGLVKWLNAKVKE